MLPDVDTAVTDPVIGCVLDGRYEVTGRVARGGMATVYVAVDRRLDRRVAVKVMHPALAEDADFVVRFHREAKAAARITHPNVVSVTDQGSDAGLVFLVMEYVAGRTLRSLLHERGRLTPTQALEICEPVAAALAAAHAAGLVHRDVKPENVLLADDGRVKVADFGLARAVAASSLTATTGLLMGTVAYLAPEQVAGGVSPDPRADVYAAGIVLFEMLTGSPPHDGETPLAVAYKHLHADIPAPSRLVPGSPAVLDALVADATARDPHRRPADGAELLSRVRRARQLVAPGGLAALGQAGGGPAGEAPTERLPDLPVSTGAPEVHVTARLEAADRRAGAPPNLPAFPTLGQPRRGARVRAVAAGLVLALVCGAAGWAGWWFGDGRYTRVPKLIGLQLQAFRAELRADALRVRMEPAVYSYTVPAGQVAEQSPRPGTRLVRGGTIRIALSRGPLLFRVPAVLGETAAAATAALHAAHLGPVAISGRYETTGTTGTVVGITPPAGTPERPGTPVTLVVDLGPPPVGVPTLYPDEPLRAAEAALTAVGLHPVVTRVYDAKVPAGDVISENPPGGVTAHVGDSVTLTESLGPQYVGVPNVVQLSPSAAAAALRAIGLVPVLEEIPGGFGGVVVATNPPAGTQVRPGTTVTVYTI